ncbi:type I glyceraldehyde-3-phosphate dehydrogenase [Spiribacter halobius]|uniref:Erythrose-4-phosphate dehydrogenase n=1 Tax=Sediminicurvatus halobius TaxID=2182432 RepID=A0A2U2MZD9_9GAMM|nr:glyceraldehyde 3-phosphate dehydrogenase NAD-binding domain-containing protein [Spiribacter halobius]PWG62351.1 erythrose-4-phosphate dehydrogenase [Spiribacter halobius]UEX79726.1 erythrose-4-phosphate dehydrogenase [Spiribacter halobius]
MADRPYRLAINGYGRIGRCLLRALAERGDATGMEVVAINDPADAAAMAHLTRHDTTHGRFPGEVALADGALEIDGRWIRLSHETDPARLPWAECGVDLVLECSGSFRDRATAEAHLTAGARRLLFSQPASSDVDVTLVRGYNQADLRRGHRIVSAASCTTNCLIPLIATLDQAFGVEHGVATTLHSAMNDQPVIDSLQSGSPRLTRSALQSMVPVDTALARGVERLMPHLAGRFECLHMRVPTINVSAMDLAVTLAQDTDAETVNAAFREAADGPLSGLFGVVDDAVASMDFNHDPRSGILDATQTRVAAGRLVKLICWFDNEWGFAHRMLDIAGDIARLDRAGGYP